MLAFEIEGSFPSFNEFQGLNRASGPAANAAKRQMEERVLCGLRQLGDFQRFDVPVDLCICWLEPSDRRDWDNVVWAKKSIRDGLVRGGVIPDDSRRWIPCPDLDCGATERKAPRIVVLVEAHDPKGGAVERFGAELKRRIGYDPLTKKGVM